MRQAMINTMTATEQRLLTETGPANLAGLDEDALLDLHGRIRRARNKYVTLYRRRAGERARTTGGRGHAYQQNQRDRDKSEVFEDALARVSRSVATAARRSADALRGERLAAAREVKGQAPPHTATTSDVTAAPRRGRAAAHRKTTGGQKRDASTQAAGARRQAKRDGR